VAEIEKAFKFPTDDRLILEDLKMATETERQVVTVFEQVFRNKDMEPPPLYPETVLDGSLGLESLDFAEVVIRLEDIFGIDPLTDGVPDGLRTIADLSRLYE
jgi:acyl carrier protein